MENKQVTTQHLERQTERESEKELAPSVFWTNASCWRAETGQLVDKRWTHKSFRAKVLMHFQTIQHRRGRTRLVLFLCGMQLHPLALGRPTGRNEDVVIARLASARVSLTFSSQRLPAGGLLPLFCCQQRPVWSCWMEGVFFSLFLFSFFQLTFRPTRFINTSSDGPPTFRTMKTIVMFKTSGARCHKKQTLL